MILMIVIAECLLQPNLLSVGEKISQDIRSLFYFTLSLWPNVFVSFCLSLPARSTRLSCDDLTFQTPFLFTCYSTETRLKILVDFSIEIQITWRQTHLNITISCTEITFSPLLPLNEPVIWWSMFPTKNCFSHKWCGLNYDYLSFYSFTKEAQNVLKSNLQIYLGLHWQSEHTMTTGTLPIHGGRSYSSIHLTNWECL